MKINYTSLNSSLEINKRQIQMSISPKTSKEDAKYKYRIDPIVSVSIAQNLILQNNRLDKAIRRDCQVLSADLLFSFQPFFLWNMKLNKPCFVLNIFLICLLKVLPK